MAVSLASLPLFSASSAPRWGWGVLVIDPERGMLRAVP